MLEEIEIVNLFYRGGTNPKMRNSIEENKSGVVTDSIWR